MYDIEKAFLSMKLKRTITFIVLLLVVIIGVAALTEFFTSASATSEFEKKTFFQIVFDAEFPSAEVGPGDEVAVSPVVTSDATEIMYVVIVVDMPVFEGSPIYEYTVDDSWTQISDEDSLVYGYGSSDEMTVLLPGDTTTPLTESLLMKNFTIPEYAYIDDINVTFNVYALGADGTSSNPDEVWAEIKERIFTL